MYSHTEMEQEGKMSKILISKKKSQTPINKNKTNNNDKKNVARCSNVVYI